MPANGTSLEIVSKIPIARVCVHPPTMVCGITICSVGCNRTRLSIRPMDNLVLYLIPYQHWIFCQISFFFFFANKGNMVVSSFSINCVRQFCFVDQGYIDGHNNQ